MKAKLLILCTLSALAILVTACGAQPTAAPETSAPVAGTIDDLDSLMDALRSAGASVEVGEEVEQAFFTTTGKILKVDGADVQVFVYDTAEAMEAEAAQVAEDGGSIGTNMVMWVEPPHFYKLGGMIILYVGQDQAILDLLNKVLGPQFAGR